jgi:GNAT superfamily N-acetyltransferase
MEIQVAELTRHDLPAIDLLEKACWPTELQASATLLESRFDSGHTMVGAWLENRLLGLIAYRHVMFDPDDIEAFPKNFEQFASGLRQDKFNAVYGYNMSVHPEMRGSSLIHDLLSGAIDRVRAEGCRYIVGDGRCPSYSGGVENGRVIRQSAIFRAAIDRYMSGGHFPVLAEFLADPTLRFFYRTMHCRFLWVLPDFFPGDAASGGFRVIYCVDLF